MTISSSVTYISARAQAEQKFRTRLGRNMEEVMQFLEKFTVSIVSDPWPPASDPNTPPHLRTGVLRASIGHDVQISPGRVTGRLGVRQGPADEYALPLELGHDNVAPRPFLRPTLLLNRRAIERGLRRKL
jgi:hypothetical protein